MERERERESERWLTYNRVEAATATARESDTRSNDLDEHGKL